MLLPLLALALLAAPEAPIVSEPLLPLVRAVYPDFDPKTNVVPSLPVDGKEARKLSGLRRFDADGAVLLVILTVNPRWDWASTLYLLKAKGAGFEVTSKLEQFCFYPEKISNFSSGALGSADSLLTFRDQQYRPFSVFRSGATLAPWPRVTPELLPQLKAVLPGLDPKTNLISADTFLQSVDAIAVPGAKLLAVTTSTCSGHVDGKLFSLTPKGDGYAVAETVERVFGTASATELLGPGITGLIFDGFEQSKVMVVSRGTALSVEIESGHRFEGDTYNSTTTTPELSFLKSRANGLLEVEEVLTSSECKSGGGCVPSRSRSVYRYDGARYRPASALRSALVKTAAATSFLVEKGSAKDSYVAEKAIDGVRESAWVEGVKGPGVGEALTLTLKAPTALKSVSLVVGCGTGALWKKNHRLKQVKVTLDGGEAKAIDLEDVEQAQRLPLTLTAPVTSLRFEIAEVFKGSAFDDACISEVLLEK